MIKTKTKNAHSDAVLLKDLSSINSLQLIRLTLKNFKGCRELTVEPNGGDLHIFGDNATGKTTVADGFFWLLFGRDSHGSATFEIKTLGEDGEPVHGLEHEVEAVLGLPSGDTLTLRKVYKEKWVKARGRAQAEFSGHTTDHWVNGVPVQEKDYRARVAEACDEQIFRLLTDPSAFNGLHWQRQREILMQVCGDVSDADVIASNPELADLPAILGRHALDDYRKMMIARRREINEQLKLLPAKISTLRESLPESGLSIPDTAEAESELQRLQEQRARIQAGGEIAEKTKRLREIESEIIAVENELRKQGNAAKEEAETTLAAKRREHADAAAEVARLESLLATHKTTAASLESRLAALRTTGRELQSLTFEFSGTETCAACGQSLPADRVAEARRIAEEEFNANKSRRLEANISEGKALRAQLDELIRSVNETESELQAASERAETLRLQGVELKRAADQIDDSSPDPSADERWVALTERRAAVAAEIETLRHANAAALADIDERASGLREQLAEAAEVKARIEVRNENIGRIAKYEAEERELAAELERIERELFVCEEFVRTKSSMLTDRINSKFSLAKFKLFDEQVNGAVVETCECTFDGVPFSSLNHGARLNVGLDIINTLSEHYQFAPPLFIDNAESITSIMPTSGQQIRLVVSASDKQLRVENAA